MNSRVLEREGEREREISQLWPQVHSWEGLLSSSDQSEVHGHETPGSRMGPLAMGLAVPHGTMGGLLASARKEEPPDKLGTQRGNPSQLLSFNSHREWESK